LGSTTSSWQSLRRSRLARSSLRPPWYCRPAICEPLRPCTSTQLPAGASAAMRREIGSCPMP